MRLIIDALQAWRVAVRDMESTAPGTESWLRARLVEDERRLEYQARVADATQPDEAGPRVPAEPPTTGG